MQYNLFNSNKIKIDRSNISGRGVFAKEDIKLGTLLEQCHFIIPEKDHGGQDANLRRYMFCFPEKDKSEEIQKEKTKIDMAKLLSYNEDFKDKAETILKLGYEKINNLLNYAVVLGHGMIYNHSHEPNVGYKFNKKDFCFDYYTIKDVNKNEELFINYGNTENRTDLK
jgi:SET domain-containing protein